MSIFESRKANVAGRAILAAAFFVMGLTTVNAAAVMIGDAIFWLTGPISFGDYSTTEKMVVVGVALASLSSSVYFSRRITGATGYGAFALNAANDD